MRVTIEDLEALKELNDELEENHVETERALNEEIGTFTRLWKSSGGDHLLLMLRIKGYPYPRTRRKGRIFRRVLSRPGAYHCPVP